jgi:tetratricopeptide (TPR) repeat protein
MSSKLSRWIELVGIGATIALVQPNIAAAKSSVAIAAPAKAITELNSVATDGRSHSRSQKLLVLSEVEVRQHDESGAKNGFNLGIPIDRLATVASNVGVNLGVQVSPIAQNPPPNAEDYFKSAVQKDEKGDYRGALADYDRAIALDPKSVYAYMWRGSLKYLKLNDIQGALADWSQAIALDPKSTDAYINRGNLKSDKLNDIQGALADYDRVILLQRDSANPHPGYAHAYYIRGLLKYEKLNDVQGALADFNEAIALAPIADTYYIRGILKSQKLNDVQGALADYSEAIALDPKSAAAYYIRGVLKSQKLNDVQGALADYNQAIALNPKYVDAYTNRGLLKYQNLDDAQGALADWNQAISLQERSAIALNPKSTPAYYMRGVLKYQHLNDLRGALADLTRAIAVNPNDANGYYNRGDLFYSTGNRVAAIADFRKVAEIDRSGYEGLIAQGVIQTQQGAYAQASELFNKAAKIIPEWGDIYKYRGEAFKQQGDRAAAIRDWRTAAQSYKNTNQPKDYQMVVGWLKSLGAGE